MPCQGCQPANPDMAKQVSRVRVWYADGSIEDGTLWAALPPDGVQAVRLDYADGTARVMEGADWYFTADGHADRIYGHADEQPQDGRYHGLMVLRGAWTDDATFAAIQRAAHGWE